MDVDRRRGAQRDETTAGEGATGGKRTRVETAYPTLARAMRSLTGDDDASVRAPSIHDAATAAVEHRGSGAPVDAGVAAQVGGYLGAELSGVRVHTDALSREASAAMGARAFAHGNDVFMGPGEQPTDLGLMAHELTHVVQQGAAGQRAIARKVEVGDAGTPAEVEADAVATAVTAGAKPAALLVDDGPVAPGQMLRSTFIGQLRAAVTAAADEELGPLYSAIGCPYIDQYFGRYGERPAQEGEALLRRFAPAVRSASDAASMIPIVVDRVRAGVRHWRDTGQAPPELAAAEPSVAAAAATAASPAALRAPDGRDSMASLVHELGPGAPLEGSVAARMSDALGADVGHVRLHTGPVAAAKADAVGAIAFAAGPHVVMAAHAPRAGTFEGDALLAHELAHTAQAMPSDPAALHAPLDTAEDAVHEESADHAAGGALARLYGGARTGMSSFVQRLQGADATFALRRCSNQPKKKEPLPDLPAGEEHVEHSVDKFVDMWEKSTGASVDDRTKKTISRGCIGLTMLGLGKNGGNPPLGLSFSTFEQAKAVMAALNEILAAKPAVDELAGLVAANPELKNLKNVLSSLPVDPDPTKWKAVVFSKRFFSRQEGTWEDKKQGDPTKFVPDENGQVDMTGYNYKGRANVRKGEGNYMINFDYGWWDPATDTWWHANHAEPGMTVYQSTLEYYSQPLVNFDRQTFVVAFAPVGK
jgi:hypothetical protein